MASPMKTYSRIESRRGGFTLIEVMITVAVVAILAAVALPSYIEYVTRSKLVEAKSNLSDMRTRMEQYFLDNRTYPTACIAAASGPAPAGKIYLPASAKFFTTACSNLSATTYTVTATGIGTGFGFVYTVDQSNTRQTTAVPAGWTTSTVCWVSRKNGDC
jgi:type IV pilus assembly protein PilE